MRSIDELRDTLDAHAGDVQETGPDAGLVRSVSIQQRVRVVRRRRRAAVAGAAAAVVAAVGGLTMLPGAEPDVSPTGEERTVLGMEAPETLTAAGYTYRFVEAVSADSARRVSDELAVSDEPRLVTWATTGADDVQVEQPNAEAYRSTDGDFEDWLLLPPGTEGDVVARAVEPGVALAVYELTDDAPAGVSGHGVTFRSEVPGMRLLNAGFAQGAADELSFEFEFVAPEGEVRIAGFCAGLPDDVMVDIDVGERGGAEISCSEEVDPDPGHGGGWLVHRSGIGVEPGERTTARMSLSDGAGAADVDRSQVLLGLGLYTATEDPVRVLGTELAPVIEAYGHEWVYARHLEGPVGERLVARLDGEGPFIVESVFRLQHRTGLDLFVDGRHVQGYEMDDEGSVGTALVSPGTGQVELASDAQPGGGRVGLVLYERAD